MIQPHRKASRSGITIRLSIIVGAPVLHELPETILNLLLMPAPPILGLKSALVTNNLTALSANVIMIMVHLDDLQNLPVNVTTIIARPQEIVIL